MRNVAATEARVHFGELMRQVVETGEPVTVERAGKPQVVLVSAAVYDQVKDYLRWAKRHRALKALCELAEQLKQDRGGVPLPSFADVIREGREERSRELDEAIRVRRREPADRPGDR